MGGQGGRSQPHVHTVLPTALIDAAQKQCTPHELLHPNAAGYSRLTESVTGWLAENPSMLTTPTLRITTCPNYLHLPLPLPLHLHLHLHLRPPLPLRTFRVTAQGHDWEGQC